MVYQHVTVVCGLYKGTDKAYILDAKEFSGGMVNNIDEAVLFLKRNLKLSYEIKEVRRKNILEIPEDALREAVINAVCHRDYFEKGARVMIEIFDDRIKITNPGGLPKGITSENFGTLSVTRNPKTYNVIKENKTITIPELSKSLNVTERQVQRIIKKLRDKMLLERKGGRKQGYWEVKK